MAKYTPAPWTLDVNNKAIVKYHNSPIISIATLNPYYDTVGRLFDSKDFPAWQRPIIGESLANGKLIAAAPELLEALKLARGVVQMVDDAEHGQLDLLVKIDAAISKAEAL